MTEKTGSWPSAIDGIARVISADSACTPGTFRVIALRGSGVREIVCLVVEGVCGRPYRPCTSGDRRKAFREKRGGKQRPGKHYPVHRVFHAAFPENRPVSVYEVSHGSLCHLGLLYGGL